MKHILRNGIGAVSAISLTAAFAWTTAAYAHHPDAGLDDGHDEVIQEGQLLPRRGDPHAAMTAHDLATHGLVSDGPFAHVNKNLTDADGALRVLSEATTDVWAHNGYAYVGTFNSPCGDGTGDNDSGIRIFDVSNHNFVGPEVANVPSVLGSRTNDVKVAAMNSGDILVHSNESCAGGPGGFEIWDVAVPTAPSHLASVQTDDVNAFLRDELGFSDFGVHNLFLFTQGGNDYVAAVVESEFGNFQIFDITDPTSPTLVGWWGAEQLQLTELGMGGTNAADLGGAEFDLILDLDAYLFSGFGASANRFLHDITITADGQQAYLANWDAGLVLLDISDPANPSLVSVAIDPVNGSLDGEVNSHSVWPSEDGTIVVEGEEDFSAWEGSVPPSNLTLDGTATPGDPTIPGTAISTTSGDFFEANPTGLTGSTDGTSVVVDGGDTYPAVELATAAGSPTFADTGTVSGNLVWVGRACGLTGVDALANPLAAGDIAVVRRGTCEFQEKADTVAAAGAAAVVIANNLDSTPWSGLRIWDYSDPANPVLASTFDTSCSASTAPGDQPDGAYCDPRGTYSSHNVIVETDPKNGKVKTYISWYSEGVLGIDVTDPYHPVEFARFHRAGDDFEADNDGIQDIWGIYKTPGEPWIYASDRNGGLYVLKEYGSGSAKKAKK